MKNKQMKKYIVLSVFTSEFCGASFLWDIFLVALEARNLVFGSIPRPCWPETLGPGKGLCSETHMAGMGDQGVNA